MSHENSSQDSKVESRPNLPDVQSEEETEATEAVLKMVDRVADYAPHLTVPGRQAVANYLTILAKNLYAMSDAEQRPSEPVHTLSDAEE